MTTLPFGALPAYAPRRFVPAHADCGDWPQLEPLFDRLGARLATCVSPADLEQWLLDWGELSAAIDEEGTRRYIAMTCHTEAAAAEKAYLHFVEEIEPRTKPRQFTLAQLYLAHAQRSRLSRDRYAVFDRDVEVQVELFREENVPLQTEENKLGQQYQKLMGSLTVPFRGEERTLAQMGRYLEETDRALRQEAWELVANRRLQEVDRLEEIFEQLISLRQRIARNAGFANYRDYAFRMHRRFDYTPEDCLRFHDTVESEFLPVLRELHAQRRTQLGVEPLRPWDLAVDPRNRAPLRPFEHVEDMIERTYRIFHRVHPELGAQFQGMRDRRLLDLDNRKGKGPGGYQSNLNESRLPFIFMNAVGQQRDVETLLHEGGHAFHALATQQEELFAYRNNVPIEFCEVASMSMELLGNEFLDEFYSPADVKRARYGHLEMIVVLFPWIATVDAFQHWIYTHPGHTRAERTAAWDALMKRFGGDTNWSGHERARSNLWHRQLHLFLSPFYYIEYGIAQLGALQVWANSKRNRPLALDSYRRALALGGSRPLPELFAAAGCRFDFGRETVKPLAGLLEQELAVLA